MYVNYLLERKCLIFNTGETGYKLSVFTFFSKSNYSKIRSLFFKKLHMHIILGSTVLYPYSNIQETRKIEKHIKLYHRNSQ